MNSSENKRNYALTLCAICAVAGAVALTVSASSMNDEKRFAETEVETVLETKGLTEESSEGEDETSIQTVQLPETTKVELNQETESEEIIMQTQLTSTLMVEQEDKIEEAAITPEIFEIPQTDIKLDRTAPLYEIYKNGYAVFVDTDLQWYIRDICNNYGFIEKYVYGMILSESTFHYDSYNGGCYGLCQINTFWIHGANINHFTDDYYLRDLTNPYDNLLTLAEMWCYARDAYDLDLMTDGGMMRVLYWHSNGRDPRGISSSKYFNIVSSYANELIPLQ